MTSRVADILTAEPLKKQQVALARERLDALIACSPENVGYGLGYFVPSQKIPIRKRQFFTIMTADGYATALVASVEYNEAKSRALITDIRPYNEFTQDPAAVLADCLRELGVANGHIGVELDFLPSRTFLALQKELPRAHFVDAERIFDHVRMLKTPEEIDLLRRCGRTVDEVYREVLPEAHPGMSETDLALRLIDRLLSKGVDSVDRIVIGSGERSAFANCPPTRRILCDGDVMRLDIFASIGGYTSDIARTAVIGGATDEQKRIWDALVEGENLVIDMIRPGVHTGEIWRRYVDHYQQKLGIEPTSNFLGHAIGLTLHEEPFIGRYHDHVLEGRTVLAVEPLYFTPTMGLHLEDELIVGADGCELISDGRGPLIEIG
ncbi:MAG: Xaa-Pro peptidase family protein [Ardenticatenaceae bacterium]|nr:Xaa-Pro peptidase family protein [Ardenticatenaceae bacterium]